MLLQKLVELLAGTGEPIFQATNGDEAMRVVDEHRPRVVVSDWVMPKMDGVELVPAHSPRRRASNRSISSC